MTDEAAHVGPPRIIGTAGHIDHGKSTLVRALTGVDPDRLPEEKRRGITIDLGFAPVRLPGGVQAAFVDVPGHERFVRTMVAGATGIDAALLVVAADEGPMPQTREHLAVLDLLDVRRGVVALTKVDLVDASWLALVDEAVRDLLAGSTLADAPTVAVSAVTGEGLDALREALAQAVSRAPLRDLAAPARLPIDRVFTLPGHGTVVTGTLVAGRIRQGDRLALEPGQREVRARAVEVHGTPRVDAQAGERTAVNLGGVNREEVRRGQVLSAPGAVQVTRSVAGDLRLLPQARLTSGNTVHVHVGTAETMGRVILLAHDEAQGTAAPDDAGEPVRVTLRDPVALAVGDRMIVRGGTPLTTLGGVRVWDTDGTRYRRHRAQSLAALAQARNAGPDVRLRVLLATSSKRVWEASEAAAALGLLDSTAAEALQNLVAQGVAIAVPGGGFAWAERWQALADDVRTRLAAYHREHPLRAGMPREELRRRAADDLDGRRFALAVGVWAEEGWLRATRDLVALSTFDPATAPEARALLARVEEGFRRAGLAASLAAVWEQAVPDPPPDKEAAQAATADRDEVVALLLRQGRLVRVGDLLLHADAVRDAETRLSQALAGRGGVTAAEFRDLLGVSRRVAVPLLEYFDMRHLTRRVGDRHEAWGGR